MGPPLQSARDSIANGVLQDDFECLFGPILSAVDACSDCFFQEIAQFKFVTESSCKSNAQVGVEVLRNKCFDGVPHCQEEYQDLGQELSWDVLSDSNFGGDLSQWEEECQVQVQEAPLVVHVLPDEPDDKIQSKRAGFAPRLNTICGPRKKPKALEDWNSLDAGAQALGIRPHKQEPKTAMQSRGRKPSRALGNHDINRQDSLVEEMSTTAFPGDKAVTATREAFSPVGVVSFNKSSKEMGRTKLVRSFSNWHKRSPSRDQSSASPSCRTGSTTRSNKVRFHQTNDFTRMRSLSAAKKHNLGSLEDGRNEVETDPIIFLNGERHHSKSFLWKPLTRKISSLGKGRNQFGRCHLFRSLSSDQSSADAIGLSSGASKRCRNSGGVFIEFVAK